MNKKAVIEMCRNLLFNGLSHVLQDIQGVGESPVKEPPQSLSYESNSDIGFLVKKCDKDGMMQQSYDYYFVAIAFSHYPVIIDAFDITKTGPDVYISYCGKAQHLFNFGNEPVVKENEELLGLMERIVYDHPELLKVINEYVARKNKREDRKGRK